MNATTPICITEHDYNRLRALVAELQRHARGIQSGADSLEETLDTAQVVEPSRVPRDIVTMNSTVEFEDLQTGERGTVTIVYPDEIDPARRCISVLSPVGAALFGLREGAEAELPLPHGRTRRIRIRSVLYQPEAQGLYAV